MPFRAPPSERTVLHTDEQLRIELAPELRATVNTWRGFLQGPAYRERMNRCLDLLAQVGAHTIIANVQALRPILAEDQLWSHDDWAPRAYAAGLRRLGVVLPTTVFAQLAVTRIVRGLDQASIHTAEFGELADAMRWIESIDR